MKKKFKCDWSKTYIRSGQVEIEAETQFEALDILDSMVGDLEGAIQYLPDENSYHVKEMLED
jgi:hypothetical protein